MKCTLVTDKEKKMSVREKGYDDYGVTKEDLNRAIEFCRTSRVENSRIVIDCAFKVKEEIGADLYYSITKGLSYDELSKKNYIPLPKGDFYGYKRKTLAMIAFKLKGLELPDKKKDIDKKVHEPMKGQLRFVL